jgi:hypothetical protein
MKLYFDPKFERGGKANGKRFITGIFYEKRVLMRVWTILSRLEKAEFTF